MKPIHLFIKTQVQALVSITAQKQLLACVISEFMVTYLTIGHHRYLCSSSTPVV